MNSTNHIPFTWEEIEDQLRKAIACQASILWHMGPKQGGFAALYAECDPSEDIDDLDKASIRIQQYALYDYAVAAYAYAYQLDDRNLASYETYCDVSCGVLNGFPQADIAGEPSPLCAMNDFPLRRMFETFLARWELYEEDSSGISVRGLSLLANMTIPAVRTSLSKEGLKLELSIVKGDEGRGAKLNTADALTWLSGRRGFVANRKAETRLAADVSAEILANTNMTFDAALRRAITTLQIDKATLGETTKQSQKWVETLLEGGLVEIDVTALRSLARALNAPEPDFLARAVKHLITIELSQVAP